MSKLYDIIIRALDSQNVSIHISFLVTIDCDIDIAHTKSSSSLCSNQYIWNCSYPFPLKKKQVVRETEKQRENIFSLLLLSGKFSQFRLIV